MESIRPTAPGTAEPDDLVQGTHIDFGEFQVRRIRTGRKTVLQFSGRAGSALTRELERLTVQTRGDVGLDFSDLDGLNPTLLPVLERARRRLQGLDRNLFLCNPPSRLSDLLALGGIAERYPVAGVGEVEKPARAAPAASPEPGRTPEAARVEMSFFQRSLKRTERLEQGLDLAARCIRKILPASAPSFPGYRFAFNYRPSEIIGGDFFDFIPLSDRLLGLSIGDVSGNGLEAAILVCLAKKVVNIRARDGYWELPLPMAGAAAGVEPAAPAPGEVLRRANGDLHGDLDRRSFVTALYGILEAPTGMFRFARAGHEKPILFGPGPGDEPKFLAADGAALGILGDGPFRAGLRAGSARLEPGQALLLYTDGIVDARGPRGQTFSRERLVDVLGRTRPGDPAAVLATLFDQVARYSGGAEPPDDMTAVLVVRDT